MTALHFRVRLVGARLCHLLAQFPLFQIQFPSPLPLFRSKLWAKRVHLIYTHTPPHLPGHSPKWRQRPITVCVCLCCVRAHTSERHVEPPLWRCPSFSNDSGLWLPLIEGKQNIIQCSVCDPPPECVCPLVCMTAAPDPGRYRRTCASPSVRVTTHAQTRRLI